MGTPKNSATANAANTPKFQTILSASGQDVLDKRSQLVFKGTEAAFRDKLTALDRKKDALELEILNLTDLSVETRDSLRPGNKEYKPTQWVDRMIELGTELALLEEEIEVAQGIYDEYFGTPTQE